MTFVAFQCWSRGEVARPESMRMMGVRKEIIGLRRPRSIGFVQRVQIARRRRIEDIDVASVDLLNAHRKEDVQRSHGWCTHLRIDIFDQFIHVLEPLIGTFVLKIAAHGHNNMIGGKAERLEGMAHRIRCLSFVAHELHDEPLE